MQKDMTIIAKAPIYLPTYPQRHTNDRTNRFQINTTFVSIGTTRK